MILAQEWIRSARLWIEELVDPGSFVFAVLRNDLVTALNKINRDPLELLELHELVSWLYTHAPVGCWGSSVAVTEWMDRTRDSRHGLLRSAPAYPKPLASEVRNG